MRESVCAFECVCDNERERESVCVRERVCVLPLLRGSSLAVQSVIPWYICVCVCLSPLCNPLQPTATLCNPLQHTYKQVLQHAATCCNTVYTLTSICCCSRSRRCTSSLRSALSGSSQRYSMRFMTRPMPNHTYVLLRCVAVCCGVLRCVAVRGSALQ